MNLILTGDGSHSLYVPELDEHYHSTYGAITESIHIFIKAGLEQHISKRNIAIFEAGFGTGLNALLTCLYAQKEINILYHSIEKNPVSFEWISKLNYPEMLKNHPGSADIFGKIHRAEWNMTHDITPRFRLHKICDNLINYVPDYSFDVIYFDAFAPEKQPEMWTQNIFKKLYDHLNPQGTFITYCVKGNVKRMLKESGFKIEKLPGPPGKREILRGVKE